MMASTVSTGSSEPYRGEPVMWASASRAKLSTGFTRPRSCTAIRRMVRSASGGSAAEAGRAGASRVIIFGDVRNSASVPYERVVVLAEGLDEGGRVVSRGRAYVTGLIPARGTASFEVRLLSAGREKRFRVGVEAYQIASPAGTQSP